MASVSRLCPRLVPPAFQTRAFAGKFGLSHDRRVALTDYLERERGSDGYVPDERLLSAGGSVWTVNVRRLAAIDMYGTSGSTRRRRIVLAEFFAGVIGMVGIGTWVLTQATDLGGRALGVWLIGAGLNYAPLAVHAVILSRAGGLDAKLA